MINSLSLPGYQLVDSEEQNEDIHFRLEAPTPVACERGGVQGEFVRFGKRDVPYRDLPIHGKRVTLWVVRRRYICRACKTTFRPQLPEIVGRCGCMSTWRRKPSIPPTPTWLIPRAWTRRRYATFSTPAPNS
ncbi:transposase family protein [Vreelandella venusta]